MAGLLTSTALQARRHGMLGAPAALAATIFWSRAVSQLHLRHPHEDAFILFRYAEHVARGEGIVFNSTGPHAEGATDFLWMLLLALGARSGVDVALTAAFLNAVGAGLLVGILVHLCFGRRKPGVIDVVFALFVAVSAPFLAGAHSSCDGFSTELYCGLAVLGYGLSVSDFRAALLATPYSALLLGLFRPDGVLLGIAVVAVAAVRKRHHAALLRQLGRHSAVALALGGAYFTWRFNYFGELLPLPLYVKSRGATPLPGLEQNTDWFLYASGLPSVFAVMTVLVLWQRRHGRVSRRSRLMLGATLPALILFAGLLFAHQSQNVDFRFQAPIFSVVLAATLALLSGVLARAKSPGARVFWCALTALALLPALHNGRQVWALDYLDSTAVALGPELDESTLVLTEAGRVPYWTRARVIDVVGLNDPRSAKHPPDRSYIASLRPDVIMYHSAGTLDEAAISLLPPEGAEGEVVRVPAAALASALVEPYRSLLTTVGADFPKQVLPHRFAAAALTNYVTTTDDFDIFLVRYGAGFRHVWAVRRGQPFSASIERTLQESARRPYLSYADAKGIRVGSLPCRLLSGLARHLGPRSLGWPQIPTCDIQGAQPSPVRSRPEPGEAH